jgi:hypothetical protein
LAAQVQAGRVEYLICLEHSPLRHREAELPQLSFELRQTRCEPQLDLSFMILSRQMVFSLLTF